MHAPPHDRRCNARTRSYSTPIVTVNPRKRKISTTAPHQLLCINTHNLHLAAPPVVDLTRLSSQSLASFTPYSESIDSQGPAQGSLRAHVHVPSQALLSIPKSATMPNADTGIAGITMPASRQRLHRFSLFEFSSTAGYPLTSPVTLNQEEHPYSCSSSPPSSPSLSIPSISRTHSTTASSSLPGTPPLPLTQLSARRNSKWPGKKMNRETVSDFRGRKRAPSLPMPLAQRKRDASPSRSRMRERTFSAFDPSYRSRLDSGTATRSRSPGCTPRSNSPSSPLSLAALETSSKLMRTVAICAVCGASGADFPRCPRCGDAWCSRACRMTARKEAGVGIDGNRGHGCKGKRTVGV